MAKRKRAEKRATAGGQTEGSPWPPGVTLLHTLAGHSDTVYSVAFSPQSGTQMHRETVLWDLAGQPAYRLVHQLSFDDACRGMRPV